MSSNQPIPTIFRDTISGYGIRSGAPVDFTLRRIRVDVLEMEDVLFHHNSAVMMPDAPAGNSSSQGTGDNPDDAQNRASQDRFSGIEALALVFKQFEFDPNKRMLITAHTDTSGQPDFNFTLSDLRARNVLFLLDGSREPWAEVCRDRHKIEDYQQIMTFFVLSPRWLWTCDPQGIDNRWGDKTETAIENFISDYNNWLAALGPSLSESQPLDPALKDQIAADSKHLWPIEMWRAVYELYEHEMASSLGTDRDALNKDYRSYIQFTNHQRETKYVACGESFPIDSSEKSNYRSQTNRRVELLFFDRNEMPTIDCPARVSSVHTRQECPIWNRLHYVPAYIDPNDLKMTAYHIKFKLYNARGDSFLDVPEGLRIRITENDSTPLGGRITFANGTYTIKVRDNPARASLDLTFETTNEWVDMSDSANPQIVTKLPDELATMHFSDQVKFYDLPQKFHSKNWTVKRGANWVRFSDTVKNTTSTSDPIEVYLDSAVLVEMQSNGNLNPLTVSSSDRFTVFDIRMRIQNPDPDRPYLTAGTLGKNFITMQFVDRPPRVVARNGIFYDGTIRRLNTGEFIGARAIVKNDPDFHHGAAIQKPTTDICGNFELHYLKNCLDNAGTGTDSILVYWSCKFVRDEDVTDADVAAIEKDGFTNVMTRWFKKRDVLKPRSDPNSRNLVVRPIFFFEYRTRAPFKCSVNLHTPTEGARSNLKLTTGNFKTDDYFGHGAGITEDGETYRFFTMAHEIGHAIGLHDEYRESLKEDKKWNPSLTAFAHPDAAPDQWYPGMPYGFDSSSMMTENKAPRLRHLWYFCRWVNETPEVRRLTGNTVFHVEKGLGKANQYFTRGGMNNFYNTVAAQEDLENGDHGILDIFLYKCGYDETTERMIIGQSDFDGTLIIRHKLQWFFDDHDGAEWNDDEAKLDYLRQFQNRIHLRLNRKYYIESFDPDFKKTYIEFVPHYYFEGSTTRDHFEIEVKANSTANKRYTADFNESDFDSDEFSVDQLQNEVSILRYCLGLKPYEEVTVLEGGHNVTRKRSVNVIEAAELNFLANWMALKRGGGHSYTVKK
jgi:hypothetical protein